MVRRTVEIGLDPSEGHYFQGQLLMARTDQKDNFAQAEREFRESLKLFPSHSNAYAWLGRSLLAQNRMDEARAAFEQSFTQNPRNAMAAYSLAKLADARGDQEGKAKYLAVCQELNVSDAWTKEQLQRAQDAADPKAGIARREELRRANPKDLTNLFALAGLYEQSGQLDKPRKPWGLL